MNGKAALIQKIKGGGMVLLDQAIVSGTSFVTGILLARFLGLETYGLFALLWLLVLFGLSFSQAFVIKPMLSLAPKMEKAESLDYFSGMHAVQLLFSSFALLLFFLGFVSAAAIALIDLPFFSIAIKVPVIVGLFLLYDFYRKCFFTENAVNKALVLDGCLSVIQVSGILALSYFQWLDLSSLLSLWIFTLAIVCTIGFFRMPLPDFSDQVIKKVASKNFQFSKWLIGTAFLQWLCGNFFIIAGGGILGNAAVGAVRIVQNIIGLTHVIFLAMENVVPVYAAGQYKSGGFEKLYRFLRKISVQTGALVLFILVTLAVLAPFIIEVLYGKEFVAYSYVLVGFCLIYLLVFIGHPLRFALRTLELTKPIFIGYVMGAVFSLLAAYPLLHYFQIYGLLAGMFMTQLIAQLVYLFYLIKVKSAYENHPLGTR